MRLRRILVVDDEPKSTQVIGEYLCKPEFDLQILPSAELAWSLLQEEGAPLPDLIVLDQMILDMDGMAVLRRMKAEARLRLIPVIMQTGAAAPTQVSEGIEAGAYYYLTKPYTPELLLAIVRAALSDVDQQRVAARYAAPNQLATQLLEQAEFRFSRMDEVAPLLELLASFCPDPAAAAIGLGELLMNAVEHGNLGITYQEKKRLRITNQWDAEISRRQALPQYAQRQVVVGVTRRPAAIEFSISDEGDGFDWRPFLKFDAARAGDPNGRGIAMARKLCFSAIEFLGKGNTVVAQVPLVLPGTKI